MKGIPVLFQPNVSLGDQQVLWRSVLPVIFHLNLQGPLYWKHISTKSFKEQNIFWVKHRIDPLAKAMWCSFIWWWVLVDNWQWFLWWSFWLPVIARSLLIWGIACREKLSHLINILYHVYQPIRSVHLISLYNMRGVYLFVLFYSNTKKSPQGS